MIKDKENLYSFIYLISTFSLALIIIFIASMYFIWPETSANVFDILQYPQYLITPLGIINIVGAILLLYPRYKALTDFVYAGYLFKFMMILFSQYATHETHQYINVVCFVLWIISYTSYRLLLHTRKIEE